VRLDTFLGYSQSVDEAFGQRQEMRVKDAHASSTPRRAMATSTITTPWNQPSPTESHQVDVAFIIAVFGSEQGW